MHRSPPPRGRARRILVVALLSALVTLPASAAAGDDDPADPQILVEGRSLRVPGLAVDVPLAVTVTGGDSDAEPPAEETVARWLVEPAEGEPLPLTVDLWSPAEGTPPSNGEVLVTVLADDVEVLSGTVVLDAVPPAPALTAEADGSAAILRWDGIQAPTGLIYRLRRQAGQDWQTIFEGPESKPVRDVELEPGVHRYQLIAGIPGAGEAMNWSPASVAKVRLGLADPTPTETGAPTEPPPPTEPAASGAAGTTTDPPVRRSAAASSPSEAIPALPGDRHPDVAVAGDIRRPVEGPLARRQRRVRRPVIAGGNAPLAVSPLGPGLRWLSTPLPRAAERHWTPRAAADAGAPIAAPPAGTLAVETGSAAAAHPGAGAATVAVVFAIFALSALLPRRVHAISRGPARTPTT